MLHPTYVKRINKLIEFLKTVPAKQFDIGRWGSCNAACGTVACIGGWAGMIPEFRRIGLRLDAEANTLYFRPTTKFDKKVCITNVMDTQAARIFFGLRDTDFEEMFHWNYYQIRYSNNGGLGEVRVTKQMAIRELRKAVRTLTRKDS